MDIKVIRSDRRTVSIQVKVDGTVIVRAPRRAKDKDIERILREKEAWIRKQLDKMERLQKAVINEGAEDTFSHSDVLKMGIEAKTVIPERVRYYAGIIGVTYGKITIRCQKTRWGSCSSQGNLNFNCLLVKAPREVLDYVVVHELCHRKEMNHSKDFWAEVAKVLPEYKTQVKWLKTEGSLLMRRMHVPDQTG